MQGRGVVGRYGPGGSTCGVVHGDGAVRLRAQQHSFAGVGEVNGNGVVRRLVIRHRLPL